jgi:hypothetical protein
MERPATENTVNQSLAPEYLATNQGVVGSNPAGRASIHAEFRAIRNSAFFFGAPSVPPPKGLSRSIELRITACRVHATGSFPRRVLEAAPSRAIGGIQPLLLKSGAISLPGA